MNWLDVRIVITKIPARVNSKNVFQLLLLCLKYILRDCPDSNCPCSYIRLCITHKVLSMLIHADCFVLSYFLYLYSSFPDAEVYRIRWETKGHGSGDHCQSTVCTKGIQVPWSILEMWWFRVSLLCWRWNTTLFTLINWYLKTALD